MTAGLPTAVVDVLADDIRFERIPADSDFAGTMLGSVVSEERVLVGLAIEANLWSKAQTLSYDAARKSIEALLLGRGWRIGNRAGAHVAAVVAAEWWLLSRPDDPAASRIARSFAASRKARNDDEYPNVNAVLRTERELRALVLDSWRLVERVRGDMGLDDNDLVPA